MVVKQKEKLEKNRHVKNNDKSKKYILRGERNVKYHDTILSKSRERQQKTQPANCLANSTDHSWWSSIAFVHDDDKGRGTLSKSEPQTL